MDTGERPRELMTLHDTAGFDADAQILEIRSCYMQVNF
jgi:hypothetical protein